MAGLIREPLPLNHPTVSILAGTQTMVSARFRPYPIEIHRQYSNDITFDFLHILQHQNPEPSSGCVAFTDDQIEREREFGGRAADEVGWTSA